MAKAKSQKSSATLGFEQQIWEAACELWGTSGDIVFNPTNYWNQCFGGYEGIGKPEPLKCNLSGYWSRRIDDYNRIVYRIDGEIIEIVQCGTHYHK